VRVRYYGPSDRPAWPGWAERNPAQWHGLMTSAVAAGNGWQSRGLYRGLAPEAGLVLVQVREPGGKVGSNAAIRRALEWLLRRGPALGVRVVNLSVGGDTVPTLRGNAVDEAVEALVRAGITVVAAAGNDGRRRLVPPATAPGAITVGGIDDKNTFDPQEVELWHSNYGRAVDGASKPELVAPSLWVVAPVLPGSSVAGEAGRLFRYRAAGGAAEARIRELKLVTPHYQHVEGTSFAAPLVASTVACMLEADPSLDPERVRAILMATASEVPGAPRSRQGAGALHAGRALALTLLQRQAEPQAATG
jgi:serine protease AprX